MLQLQLYNNGIYHLRERQGSAMPSADKAERLDFLCLSEIGPGEDPEPDAERTDR